MDQPTLTNVFRNAVGVFEEHLRGIRPIGTTKDDLVRGMSAGDKGDTLLLLLFAKIVVPLHAARIARSHRRTELTEAIIEAADGALERRLLCQGRAKKPVDCPDFRAFESYVFTCVETAFQNLLDRTNKPTEGGDLLDILMAREAEEFARLNQTRLPPELRDWATQQFPQQDFLRGVQDVQEKGGFALADFLDELIQTVSKGSEHA